MILQDKVKTFCYLGLMPFIFIPIVSWISPNLAFDYHLITIFFSWSLLMAIFMTGTLWGLSLKLNRSIVPSIFIFGLLFLIYLSNIFLGIKYLIFILIALLIIYEIIQRYEKELILEFDWYQELRFYLTFSLRICHLLMIAFIFTYQ